jgi:hypothetical protein
VEHDGLQAAEAAVPLEQEILQLVDQEEMVEALVETTDLIPLLILEEQSIQAEVQVVEIKLQDLVVNMRAVQEAQVL